MSFSGIFPFNSFQPQWVQVTKAMEKKTEEKEGNIFKLHVSNLRSGYELDKYKVNSQ